MSHIAIVGAGLIGRAWAFVFARSGFEVRVWDPDETVLERLDTDIKTMIEQTALFGQAGSNPEKTAANIKGVDTLKETLDGAMLAQENGPEILTIKREIFAELDALSAPETILASSSSALLASSFAGELPRASRCLVGHPVNPPHLVPVVEVSPAPFTSTQTTEKAIEIYAQAGQVPVLLKREIDGFILNRLQAVVLAESLRLIEQGYVDVKGLDDTIKHGLGRRWAFMGPLETINLNAPGGAVDYLTRYGQMMAGLSKTSAREEAFNEIAATLVGEAFSDISTPETVRIRQNWRDTELAALAQHLAKRAAHDKTRNQP